MQQQVLYFAKEADFIIYIKSEYFSAALSEFFKQK